MSADLLAILIRVSLASSAGVLLVLALRTPMRHWFGARVSYALWLLVPAAAFAVLLPARRVFVAASETVGAASDAAAPAPGALIAAASPLQTAAALDLAPYLLALWCAGVLTSVGLLWRGQQRFLARARLQRAGADVFRADRGDVGPALVGVMRPRIVLPADFERRYDAAERALVLAHERAHLRAGDAQVNALAALVQCLNWYNPLFYVARACLRVDQELACDERVMQRHAGERRVYAEAMLKTQLAGRAAPLGCHWPAIGLKPTKERILMLARPTPSRLRRVFGGALCTAAAIAAGAVVWAAQPAEPAYARGERLLRGDLRASALGDDLVEAIQEGDFTRAAALIEAGADVNHFRRGDGTPLVAAARMGADDLVAQLIAAGADANAAAPRDGNPLIWAAVRNDVAMSTLLIENGADVNAIVPYDETPLINAARVNALDVAQLLIARGADVNLAVEVRTPRGRELRSPMQMARRNGHAEMIALLRANGARN